VTSPIPQRVLVYDRILQNRVKTAFLATVAVLSILPFVAALGWGAYEALGRVSYYTAPMGNNVLGPINRARERAKKLAEASPDKLRALHPKYESLLKDERKLYEDWRGGKLSEAGLQQQIDRINEESESLNNETDRVLDPEGAARREQQRKQDAESRVWLSAALAFFAVAALAVVFFGLMRSPGAKALAFCGARPAGQSEPEVEARRLLENLAIGAGLPAPKLYVIGSMAPNALAAGMDPRDSTVVVTTGLLKLLDRRELEGVLAHELAHIGNRDTRLSMVVFAITFFLRLPNLLWKGAKPDGPQNLTQMRFGFRFGRMFIRAIGLVAFVYIAFIAPFLAMLIRAAISRSREALADADAALLTRNPEGLLRALAKIWGAGSVVSGSSPLVSHLYFSDPSGASIGVGFFRGSLLSSHPPIEERIVRLREFGAAVSPAVIEEAKKVGENYAYDNMSTAQILAPIKPPEDELAVLAAADTRSGVFRLLSAMPVALYERDDPQSSIVASVAPGTLVVGFDYRSRMRQVLTQDRTFGYLPRAAKLAVVKMTAEEAFAAPMPVPPVATAPPLAAMAAAAVAAAGSSAPQAAPAPQPSAPAQAAPEPTAPAQAAPEPLTLVPQEKTEAADPAPPPAVVQGAPEPEPAAVPQQQAAPADPPPPPTVVQAAPELQPAAPVPQEKAEAADPPPAVGDSAPQAAAVPQGAAATVAPPVAAQAPPAQSPAAQTPAPAVVQQAAPASGLSSAQVLAWALAGVLAVAGVLMAVKLALTALAAH
jgi:heat shock protein HtpX